MGFCNAILSISVDEIPGWDALHVSGFHVFCSMG